MGTHAAVVTAALGVTLALAGCGQGGGARPSANLAARAPAECAGANVALLVLGSGGPILDGDRAGSGYVVLVDGAPQVLVDAGPGVGLRLAQAHLNPSALRAILVSHLHVDHSADLITLLKSNSFSGRRDPLPLLGPDGSGPFPAFRDFMEAQLGAGGTYAYLDYLGAGASFPLELHEVAWRAPAASLELGGVRVDAVGVPHGPVPALGFVVHAAGRRIAFGGDQTLEDPRFLELARGADLLIAHHAIPESADGVAARLHARPSQIGSFAERALVRRLVLSHHMERSLAQLDEGLSRISAAYSGPVAMAADLDCFRVE